jgi:hypothetical protein
MSAALAEEFPGWEVTIRPAGLGVVTAYWCSEDGRARRFIAAPSASLLRARLRAIEESQDAEQHSDEA